MIKHLIAQNFKAVPWLETSQLMQHHKSGINFSTDKPNVLIGPNGAGKSALLRAIALKTLSHYIGQSELDQKYLMKDEFWWAENLWSDRYVFLKGLRCDTDMAPAIFYRPNHIPGNEPAVGHAMMMGYSKEARHFGELTRNKSSGQQAQAVQIDRVWRVLAGEPLEYERRWRYLDDYTVRRDRNPMPWDYKARIMLDQYVKGYDGKGKPLVFMDEPEQSLDIRAELNLWQKILLADMSKVQVIIATHSVYPILHPAGFHIIEAVPGYADEVRKFLL